MTKTITWGPIRTHDGSDKCPDDAFDVPCMVCLWEYWRGDHGKYTGSGWFSAWENVTAYRLPVTATAPAADPALDALVEALENTISPFDWETADMFYKRVLEFNSAALALAKGEKP